MSIAAAAISSLPTGPTSYRGWSKKIRRRHADGARFRWLESAADDCPLLQPWYDDHATPCPVRPLILPAQLSMAQVRESAASCTGCDLYKHATKRFLARGRPHRQSCSSGNNQATRKTCRSSVCGPREFSTRLGEAGIADAVSKVDLVIITGIAGDNCVLLYARRCLDAGV